jgi:hypothetical protein
MLALPEKSFLSLLPLEIKDMIANFVSPIGYSYKHNKALVKELFMAQCLEMSDETLMSNEFNNTIGTGDNMFILGRDDN